MHGQGSSLIGQYKISRIFGLIIRKRVTEKEGKIADRNVIL